MAFQRIAVLDSLGSLAALARRANPIRETDLNGARDASA